MAEQLYDKIAVGKLKNEVVIDDRIYLSKSIGPGTRLRQATLIGYPHLIILGKQVKILIHTTIIHWIRVHNVTAFIYFITFKKKALGKSRLIELEDQLSGNKENIHINHIVDHIHQVYEKKDICTL